MGIIKVSLFGLTRSPLVVKFRWYLKTCYMDYGEKYAAIKKVVRISTTRWKGAQEHPKYQTGNTKLVLNDIICSMFFVRFIRIKHKFNAYYRMFKISTKGFFKPDKYKLYLLSKQNPYDSFTKNFPEWRTRRMGCQKTSKNCSIIWKVDTK